MTIEEAVREVLESHVAFAAEDHFRQKHDTEAARDLAERIAWYGEAMHDRGNSHRTVWGYVSEDRQVKALSAAIAAFRIHD